MPTAVRPDRWTCELLPHPPRRTRTRGLGFWNGKPTGTAEGQRGGESRSFIWEKDGPREFAVPGLRIAHLNAGVFGGMATGTGEVKGESHAMLFRHGATGIEAVDLHDPKFWRTGASGCADGRQAGYGLMKGQGYSTALTWNGTAETIRELPILGEWKDCEARGIGGGQIVGRAGGPGVVRACRWPEKGDPVDLHPGGLENSECVAAADGEQVGTAWLDLERTVPILWRGDAGSAVILTPPGMQGGGGSACAKGFQAGWAAVDKALKLPHAALWAGTADSFTDLHAFVPEGPFNISAIHALRIEGTTISAIGQVEQYVDGTYPLCRAALWTATVT